MFWTHIPVIKINLLDGYFQRVRRQPRWLFSIPCNPRIITRYSNPHNFFGKIHFLTCSMAVFKGSGEKNIAILGISSISRFGGNKICEMTVKKIFDQPGKICKKRFHYFAWKWPSTFVQLQDIQLHCHLPSL